FVATETESALPSPSMSADSERTSHTGNPRPRSTWASLGGMSDGVREGAVSEWTGCHAGSTPSPILVSADPSTPIVKTTAEPSFDRSNAIEAPLGDHEGFW